MASLFSFCSPPERHLILLDFPNYPVKTFVCGSPKLVEFLGTPKDMGDPLGPILYIHTTPNPKSLKDMGSWYGKLPAKGCLVIGSAWNHP